MSHLEPAAVYPEEEPGGGRGASSGGKWKNRLAITVDDYG